MKSKRCVKFPFSESVNMSYVLDQNIRKIFELKSPCKIGVKVTLLQKKTAFYSCKKNATIMINIMI